MSQKPSQKLTKRVVDACHPGPKDRVIFDSELRGFGLKVTPAGRKVYILQYRMGGRASVTRRHTIGAHGELTPDQARSQAILLRGQIRTGIDPQEEKKARAQHLSKARTFAETAEEHLRHVAKTLGQTQHTPEHACFAFASMIVERILRQIDEAGVERSQFRRRVPQISLGSDLTANLQQPRRQITQKLGRQELPGAQLHRRRPFGRRRRRQILVLIRNGFIRQLHGHASLVLPPP